MHIRITSWPLPHEASYVAKTRSVALCFPNNTKHVLADHKFRAAPRRADSLANYHCVGIVRDIAAKLRLLTVLCALLVPCAAHAAEPGKMTVLSAFGQPLNVEIALVSVRDASTIAARLGAPQAYRDAGLDYNPALDSTRITVQQRQNGDLYLQATTTRALNEPFVELLVRLESSAGRVDARYTVLLDPPGYAKAPTEIAPVVAASVTPPPSVKAPLSMPAASSVPRAAYPVSTAAPRRGDTRPPPGHLRLLDVPRTAVAPLLDGSLDDAVWKGAVVADRFWISEQQHWPAEQTEVLVMADREHLYFGFRVYDSQPQAIQALQTRRGAGLGLDDRVSVELDPFLSYREISTYSVNANGVQDDAIAGGRARQLAWKGDWHAVAVRTRYGWSVEMAIPFGILNFEEGTTTIGVNFLRYHHRTTEWSRWADVTAQNLPEEMGRLTGLQLPVSDKKQPWTVMPYVLVGKDIPDKRGTVRDSLVNAGAELRYQPRPNLTGVISLNPDFSQVESAITNINFNYNEKFRADTRPFFQEGSAYFGNTRGYFYSIRIPDFDYGGKFFTRTSGYQVGGLYTRAPDDRSDLVFRAEREFDATHSLGGMVVATDRPGLKNSLYVMRGQGREPSGFNYALDLASTSTTGQPGDGSRMYGSVGWAQDHWSVGVNADRYSVNYRPVNGLLERDLPDTRGATAFASYYRDLGDGPLRELKGDLSWITRETGDGRLQRRFWYLGGSVELRQQVRTGLWYNDGRYRPVAGAAGTWSADLNHDHFWTGAVDFNTRSSRLGYGASYSSGFLGGDDYDYLIAYVWVRPTATTFVNATTERLSNFGEFDQTVISAGWDITSHQTLLARYITAFYGNAYRLAYSIQVRKNVDFFVVYDRVPDALARISAKIVMTFQ